MTLERARVGGHPAAPPDWPRGRRVMLGGAVAAWATAGLALWIGAGAACPGGACRVPELDRQLLGALNALQRPWLDAFLATATWFGSSAVLLPAALALSWWYLRRGNRVAAVALPVAVGGASLLAHACKLLVARLRPDLEPALTALPSDLSFPSAHALQVTAFAFAWLLASGSRPGWAGIAAAVSIVLAVALSRVYLQVHFPSDVLVGMIAGAGWAVGLRLLLGAHA